MSTDQTTIPETLPFSAVETLMWNAEADPTLRFRIVGVVVLDREPDREILRDRVDRLTRVVPRLRHRVVPSPMTGLRPHWELEPHFDLSFHLREQHVPGASVDDVLQIASRERQDDFPAGRPLWRATLVTGLVGGKAALVMVMHHVITDGIGAVRMASVLFDLDEAGLSAEDLGEMPAIAPVRQRPMLERMLAGVRQEVEQLGSLPSLVSGAATSSRSPREIGRSLLDAAMTGARFAPLPSAGSPLPRTACPNDLYLTLEVPVAGLKAAGRVAGGRFNDAYLAALVGGLTRYHEQHGLPVESLTVTMPVNTRAQSSTEHGGNEILLKVASLPTDVIHPAARIAAFSKILGAEQTAGSHLFSVALTQTLSRLPGPVLRTALGTLADSLDLNTTNVPGVPVPLYLAGAGIECIYPFINRGRSPLTAALISYNGTAHVTLTIDPAAIDDPDMLRKCIQAEMEAVVALASPATVRS